MTDYRAFARETGHRTLEVFVLDRSACQVSADFTAAVSLELADQVLIRSGFRRTGRWQEEGSAWAADVARQQPHYFSDIQRGWLVLYRVTCVCGWQSRPHAFRSLAGHFLLMHMIRSAEENQHL